MYVGRSRDTIRDELLAYWSAEYAAASSPLPLLVAPGSDVYLWASALAVILEGLEAQAESVGRDILPDQASPEALARHGYVDGVPRRLGSVAAFTATVTSAVDGAKTIPLRTLIAYSDGSTYNVLDGSVTINAGVGTIRATATAPGTASSRNPGDTLTFVSAPTGLDATATVQGPLTTPSGATPTPGVGTESDASYATRIVARRQERPAGGNRADWAEWPESFLGTIIRKAFVYPLLEPPASFPGAGTPNTLGCVTVVAVGPAPGDSLTNTAIVPRDDVADRVAGAQLILIQGYIEGRVSALGTILGGDFGTQLRPTTVAPENYSIEAIGTDVRQVVVQCTMNAANAFPFTSNPVVHASSTATSLVVIGDYTALQGKRAQVFPTSGSGGPGARLGKWEAHTLGPASFAAGNTTFNQTSDPMLSNGTPLTGSVLYGAPASYEALRLAAIAFFQALTPGDTTPASRWPAESEEYRATFYRRALEATLVTTEGGGVLSCTVMVPNSNVTPAAKAVVTMDEFRVIP